MVLVLGLYMKKYNLTFLIRVNGGKYRELLNLLELELSNTKLEGCSNRAIYQSIEDLNAITFVEQWNDLKLLKSSFKSPRFIYIMGAIKNLSDDWTMEVLESLEVKELKTLTI